MVEIQFGEGGEDSKIFVHELFAAYVKYAECRKLESTILMSSEGRVLASFKGRGAGKAFAKEAGKHVCQRVPPTENKGRRHTSIVSVSVLPMPDKSVPLIPLSEIDVTTTKGTGPGGQHRNKTELAVRMVHRPTKIHVFIDGRSQHQNKQEALKVLTARVQEHLMQKKRKEHAEARKHQMGGGNRGDKIRTYNFTQGRVKDHRSNKKADPKQVMKGRFDLVN